MRYRAVRLILALGVFASFVAACSSSQNRPNAVIASKVDRHLMFVFGPMGQTPEWYDRHCSLTSDLRHFGQSRDVAYDKLNAKPADMRVVMSCKDEFTPAVSDPGMYFPAYLDMIQNGPRGPACLRGGAMKTAPTLVAGSAGEVPVFLLDCGRGKGRVS